MNCPKCGKEILHENATYCPSCGASLEVKQKRSDYVLVAAILTIVAAAFSASVAYNAFYQYLQLTDYYGPQSEFLGFLIFGIPNVIAAAIAIVGAIFMLKRKFTVLSMLGAIIPLVSTVVTYMTIYFYMPAGAQAALFTETFFLSELSIIIFAILSTIMVFISRDEFK